MQDRTGLLQLSPPHRGEFVTYRSDLPAVVVEPRPAEAGHLHVPLDDQVTGERLGDVADVAQALLLRGRLEREVAEAEHQSEEGLVDGDVEDPGQRRDRAPGWISEPVG